MDPQRWEVIERMYHLARERKAEEREKSLEEACGGGDFLRREVQSLLARPAKGQHFLEPPVLEAAARAIAEAGPSSHPHDSCRYRDGTSEMGTKV